MVVTLLSTWWDFKSPWKQTHWRWWTTDFENRHFYSAEVIQLRQYFKELRTFSKISDHVCLLWLDTFVDKTQLNVFWPPLPRGTFWNLTLHVHCRGQWLTQVNTGPRVEDWGIRDVFLAKTEAVHVSRKSLTENHPHENESSKWAR